MSIIFIRFFTIFLSLEKTLLFSITLAAFPDGNSALMLAAARLRHIVGTQWGIKRYMNMDRLKELKREQLAVLEGAVG